MQYATNHPLAGARVVVADGPTLTTDANGRFELGADTKPGETPLPVTIEATGHLTRRTFLRWERGQRETTVDLIPNGRPFSASFFRQLLRDAYDAPRSVMFPYTTAGCPAGVLSADERYHAALAYRRSPGHVEPDTDTDVTPLSASTPIEVAN